MIKIHSDAENRIKRLLGDIIVETKKDLEALEKDEQKYKNWSKTNK